MIIDLKKFISTERVYWTELETMLDKIEKGPDQRMNLNGLKRFHYLYQRASSDLAKIMTFSAEPNIRRYLESLVGRAYGEIHETRDRSVRATPTSWFFYTFPRTFRRHFRAFVISALAFAVGCTFGGFAIGIDPEAKEILMPFEHLRGDPSDRVQKEEAADTDRLAGRKASFSSYLMTHNTKVSIFTLALGMTYGIGTLIMLFYNGVILGAVALDYLLAGESQFLLAWLLPHGSVEIPAILLAGQAGIVLAGALIGWDKPVSLKARLRFITKDLVTLIAGVALMLVWAGIIEAFFSQYHEPVIPYAGKIGFGMLELLMLILFFALSGKKRPDTFNSRRKRWTFLKKTN